MVMRHYMNSLFSTRRYLLYNITSLTENNNNIIYKRLIKLYLLLCISGEGSETI